MKRVISFIAFIFLVSCSVHSEAIASTPTTYSKQISTLTIPSITKIPPNETATIPTKISTTEPEISGCVITHNETLQNGSYLVIMDYVNHQNLIQFLDRSGNIIREVTCQGVILQEIAKTISPDGKWLAYYSSKDLDRSKFEFTEESDLSLNLLNLEAGENQVVTHVLSQDFPDIFEKASMELNNSSLQPVDLYFSFMNGFYRSLSWSPDGKYLAFAGQMDGLSSDIYLYDLEKDSFKRMSSGPEEVQNIYWSPDGKWIINASCFYAGAGMTYSIYSTSLDGSTINLLAENNYSDQVDWMYDTTYLFSDFVWVGIEGTGNPRLIDIRNGKKSKIWNSDSSAVTISDDHQWVIFYSEYSALPTFSDEGERLTDPVYDPGLYLVDLDGLTTKRLNMQFENDLKDYFADDINVVDSNQYLFSLCLAFDNQYYYVSKEGQLVSLEKDCDQYYLTPTGEFIDRQGDDYYYSLSPDKKSIAAIGETIKIFQSDGTFVREVELPESVSGLDRDEILWMPNSSGMFISFQYRNSGEEPIQLIRLDLLAGEPQMVDDLKVSNYSRYTFITVPE